MMLLLSTHLHNLHHSVSSIGLDCLEINLNISHECVPSISLPILHHELSRCVCLITEPLFKFLSRWLLCAFLSLFMMHPFCSGTNANLLKWRLDSSILYLNLCFSSWTFWYDAFRRISGEIEHSFCTSEHLGQKRNKNETLITSALGESSHFPPH